jgi:hypothetical protein
MVSNNIKLPILLVIEKNVLLEDRMLVGGLL